MRSFLLGGESGEAADLKEMDGGVELLLSTFFLVLGSGNSDSDFSWDVSASSRPEVLVQRGIHSHVLHSAENTNQLNPMEPFEHQ